MLRETDEKMLGQIAQQEAKLQINNKIVARNEILKKIQET
jgi:hypothetical protein